MSIGRGLLGVAATFAAVVAPLAANALERDCRPQLALAAASVTPELFRVDGSDPVPFAFDGSADPKCPSPSLGCRRPEQLTPGDLVVVSGRSGPFACASLVGPPPALREIHGWAPAAKLVPVNGGGGARWAGAWRSSSDQNITIRKRGRDGLSLAGSATWGGGETGSVAAGLVNTGAFEARATPSGNHLKFETAGCAGRMWRLGPYLVVGDNSGCGGMNVTFSGIYRRGPSGGGSTRRGA